MENSHGGRVTLRLTETEHDHVKYAGELATVVARWPVSVSIVLTDGAVEMAGEMAQAPEWLVGFARSTLRTAWRSAKTGTPWPRRVNRWRAEPEGKE